MRRDGYRAFNGLTFLRIRMDLTLSDLQDVATLHPEGLMFLCVRMDALSLPGDILTLILLDKSRVTNFFIDREL